MIKIQAKNVKRKNANQALNHFICLLCMQTISHEKGYTDEKGRAIALDDNGKKSHDCPALSH
jgi:hypothetical protein